MTDEELDELALERLVNLARDYGKDGVIAMKLLSVVRELLGL